MTNLIKCVELWECPVCGWITDGRNEIHGPITSQAHCQGFPQRHKRIKMQRATYAPVNQIIERLEEIVANINDPEFMDSDCDTINDCESALEALISELRSGT